MDKKIVAVKRSNDKKMDNLVKIDKKRDSKIHKCDKLMKKGMK